MKSRWITIAIALVAGSAFAISVQAGRWWIAGEMAIGPFGSRGCFGGDCKVTGLRWIGGDELWLRSAIATGAAGLIAMFALVALAGALAARRAGVLAAKLSLAAILTAAAAGGLFLVRFPGLGGAHVDLGVALYGGAIVAGTYAAIAALRTARAR